MAGLFSRWWAAQHGRQYSILATLFGAFLILFLTGLFQLLFLQESEDWGEYTGLAIGILVAAATGLIFVTPEFLVFKGHVATLDELYEIQSTAELKRLRSEGDRSAAALGAVAAARAAARARAARAATMAPTLQPRLQPRRRRRTLLT